MVGHPQIMTSQYKNKITLCWNWQTRRQEFIYLRRILKHTFFHSNFSLSVNSPEQHTVQGKHFY